MRKKLFTLSALTFGVALAVVLTSCGGSDSSKPAAAKSAGSTAKSEDKDKKLVPVFLTETFKVPAKHLWVCLHEVKVSTPKGPVTVFSDPKGRFIDLCTLNKEGTPHSLFLGNAEVGSKADIVRATLEFDKYYWRQREGHPSEKKTFASSSTSPQGRTNLQLTLHSKQNFSEKEPLVIDLNTTRLSENPDRESVLTLRAEDSKAVSVQKHAYQIPSIIEGTVSDLNSTDANIKFTLKTGGDQKIPVATKPDTRTLSHHGEPNPLLSDDKHVQIHGIYDPHARSFAPHTIIVRKQPRAEDSIILSGSVEEFSVPTSQITLMPEGLSGAAPNPHNLIHVSLKENATLLDEHGKPLNKTEFNRRIHGAHVHIEATKDEKDQQIKADWIKISKEKQTRTPIKS